MVTDRTALLAVPLGAVSLLWPALWNGYPIVFADTGTYLSQAVHLYAGWDRPVFYSLFILPLHGTMTLWPVVMVQALLTAWILWVVGRALVPGLSAVAFAAGMAVLSLCTWLPWNVSEVTPDLFTPLLVLMMGLLAWVPERLSRREQGAFAMLATIMIASQQSSLPLACVLACMLGLLGFCDRRTARPAGFNGLQQAAAASAWSGLELQGMSDGLTASVAAKAFPLVRPASVFGPWRAGSIFSAGPGLGARWLLLVVPPVLAMVGLCAVNLAAHGRFAVSPFGNIFVLARVMYDGPGMATLESECATTHWRLCAFLGRFPADSDGFLWSPDSPLYLAGGPKLVSLEANAIIRTALISDPAGEARAALGNALEQLRRFDSGDGLEPWPDQVGRWIERDFPAAEWAVYASARQQTERLAVPGVVLVLHRATALAGVAGAIFLLPVALRRRAGCTGLLLAVLLALPVSAAITGGFSAPHDRYQSRIMWLPAFVTVVSFISLRCDSPRSDKQRKRLLTARGVPDASTK